MIGLPSSSYCTHSNSAWAAPWAMPPCCWPATSSGLRMRPQSSTAMWRSSLTPAGLGVDLDHRDVGAERDRSSRCRRSRARGGAGRARCPRAAGPGPCDATASSAHDTASGRHAGDLQAAVADDDVVRRRPRAGGRRCCLAWSSTSLDATNTALPAVCSEREPIVPAPRGHRGGVGVDELDLAPSGCRAPRWRAWRRRCGGPGRGRWCRRTRWPCRRRGPRPRRTRRAGRPGR